MTSQAIAAATREKALSPTLEPEGLADDDHEDILSQVVGLIPRPGDPRQPSADQRQVDASQPAPVGGISPGQLEPVEQAAGCRHRVHRRCPAPASLPLVRTGIILATSPDCIPVMPSKAV
jgi:hypothetical protein